MICKKSKWKVIFFFHPTGAFYIWMIFISHENMRTDIKREIKLCVMEKWMLFEKKKKTKKKKSHSWFVQQMVIFRHHLLYIPCIYICIYIYTYINITLSSFRVCKVHPLIQFVLSGPYFFLLCNLSTTISTDIAIGLPADFYPIYIYICICICTYTQKHSLKTKNLYKTEKKYIFSCDCI